VARRGTPAKPAQATAKKKPSTSHKAPAKKKKTTSRTTRKAA
jgi:hypothetical protein